MREHPELLAQMDRLIKGLRALARLTASADEVEQEFRNFTEKLLAHEADENRVLKEGFGINVSYWGRTLGNGSQALWFELLSCVMQS